MKTSEGGRAVDRLIITTTKTSIVIIKITKRNRGGGGGEVYFIKVKSISKIISNIINLQYNFNKKLIFIIHS